MLSSFHLSSVTLTYKLNSLFHFFQPVMAQSSSENSRKKKKRERKYFGLTLPTRKEIVWESILKKNTEVESREELVILLGCMLALLGPFTLIAMTDFLTPSYSLLLLNLPVFSHK